MKLSAIFIVVIQAAPGSSGELSRFNEWASSRVDKFVADWWARAVETFDFASDNWEQFSVTVHEVGLTGINYVE